MNSPDCQGLTHSLSKERGCLARSDNSSRDGGMAASATRNHILRMRPHCAVLLATGLWLVACAPPQDAFDYDYLLRGGTVVDGTGAPQFVADVAIAGDRIAAISRDGSIDPAGARIVLDVEGLIVAPGFIDTHAHIQTEVDDRPLLENFLWQGLTTIMATLHSGDQPTPYAEYLASLEMAPNVGYFAGHTWTRKQVLGYDNRAPTADELEEMKALVRETMEEGALGLSTGLLYATSRPEISHSLLTEAATTTLTAAGRM